MSRGKCSFNDSLALEFPFLEKRPHKGDPDGGVYCKKCRTTFSIANSGRSQIAQHLGTKCHLKADKGMNYDTELFTGHSAISTSDTTLQQKPAGQHCSRCLICGAVANLSDKVTPKNFSDQTSEDDNNDNVSADSQSTNMPCILRHQLHVIFLLRTVFGLPSETLEHYLKTKGNPDGWITLCSTCDKLTKTARRLHLQVLEISQKFIYLKQEIREKLKTTCSSYYHPKRKVSVKHRRKDSSPSHSKNSIDLPDINIDTHRIVCGETCNLTPPPIKRRLTTASSAPVKFVDVVHKGKSARVQQVSMPPSKEKVQFSAGYEDSIVAVKIEPDEVNDWNTEVTAEHVIKPASSKTEEATDFVKELENYPNYIYGENGDDSDGGLSDGGQAGNDDDDDWNPETQTNNNTDPDHSRLPSRKVNNTKKFDVNFIDEYKPAFCVPKPDRQQCDICNQWKNLSQMRSHMTKHLGKEGWACGACHQVFPSRSVFFRHLGRTLLNCRFDAKSEARLHKRHICKVCSEEFPDEGGLFNHIFETHEANDSLDKIFECKICLIKYRSEPGLDFHFNKHIHNGRKLLRNGNTRTYQHPPKASGLLRRCEVCGKRMSKEALQDHLREHDDTGEDKVQCSLCERFLSDRDAYIFHLHKSHKDVDKPCHLCLKEDGVMEVFGNVSQLRGHYFHVHKIGMERICEYCEKTFLTDDALGRHITIHHLDKSDKLTCDMCIKWSEDRHLAYFQSQKALDRHLIKVHKSNQVKCERCETYFQCKADHHEHEKNMHKADPFVCQVCQKEFDHAVAFKRHQLRHEKPPAERLPNYQVLKCSICSRGFRTQSKFREHQLAHTGEKRYKCCHCGKQYTCVRSWRHHEAKHLPGGLPRTFVCEVCGLGFTRKPLLRDHMSIHTGERNHACQYCGDTFRLRKTLRQHQRLKHKMEISKEGKNIRSTSMSV